MSDALKIRVKKSHIAVLSVVVLVASASAAVNIRDPMNVFGGLNMQQNEITNTTKVEFGTDYLQKYSGNDNKIDINELGTAGQDFASGEISQGQLRMVEIMFDNGIPVTNDVVRRFDNDNNGQISITELGAAGSAFASTGPDSITLGELQTIGYYHRNDLEVGEPLEITAAMKTTNGKLIASGIAGRDKSNFSVRTNINMNGNNIYDVGNLGSGGGGGSQVNSAPALAWSESEPVEARSSESVTLECGPREVLRDAVCEVRKSGNNPMVPCGSRSETSASLSDDDVGINPIYVNGFRVVGTCVPQEAVKRTVFNDQNSSHTFNVPQGASTVTYELHGGSGGDVSIDDNGHDDRSINIDVDGGDGGYAEGTIPVDGGETLNVYVGQNGAGRGPFWDSADSRGGCVPFNGVKCGGEGAGGYTLEPPDGEGSLLRTGGSGGGAPTILADSEDNILVATGGGGGRESGAGGGAGGGTGMGEGSNRGEDGDNTPKNLGGDAKNSAGFPEGRLAGGTFIGEDVSAESTGTTGESPRVDLAAFS